MKKLRLYIDTSVFGGIFDTEEPKRVNTAVEIISPEEVTGDGEVEI
jgi:RNA binding exosome subunit